MEQDKKKERSDCLMTSSIKSIKGVLAEPITKGEVKKEVWEEGKISKELKVKGNIKGN